MDPLAIAQLFERLHDYFIAAGFALARMTGVIIVMPAFTRIGAPGILRPAIALALASTRPGCPSTGGASIAASG